MFTFFKTWKWFHLFLQPFPWLLNNLLETTDLHQNAINAGLSQIPTHLYGWTRKVYSQFWSRKQNRLHLVWTLSWNSKLTNVLIQSTKMSSILWLHDDPSLKIFTSATHMHANAHIHPTDSTWMLSMHHCVMLNWDWKNPGLEHL